MTLQKIESTDLIEILENGCVQVRKKTSVLEDGLELSSKFNRYVILPGDDYSQEDSRTQAICAVVQTPEIIDAYKKTLEVQQEQLKE